ncbi:MAG: bi-domain-containing oxidoreductase [Saprospiraceae bacterium]|nr:bi-domain-containing oxidoreductase [Saprospiraceae bacterium]
MKQIIQNLSDGSTYLIETEIPSPSEFEVVIHNSHSLISSGTEKMLTDFGKQSWLGKIKSQPDKFFQVLEKAKSEGLLATYRKVKLKLDQPIPLGYSSAGVVIAAGEKVRNFKVGDRVISNGPHAEFVCISENLVCRIPEELSFENAAFTVVGAIALHGVRLVSPTIGEKIVVIGLGLIGLLTAQILKIGGAEVIGIDIDPTKVDLAKSLGISAYTSVDSDQTIQEILFWSSGLGVDAVVITASSSSNQIIHQASQMCRKRARIVLIGVVGLDLKRDDFYKKEISFQVSCSYGPGRYDLNYETKNMDFPHAYVRWTENRNFQAVLKMIQNGQLQVDKLISKIVPLEDYDQVYSQLGQQDKLAVLFKYNFQESEKKPVWNVHQQIAGQSKNPGIAVIGSGAFVTTVILPTLKKLDANIVSINSSNSAQVGFLSQKYKIKKFQQDSKSVFLDSDTHGVIIANRHKDHAGLVMEGLQNHKSIFVEKPLALSLEELEGIKNEMLESKGSLMVGYNRRFSKYSRYLKMQLIQSNAPMQLVGIMNAGSIPMDHWIQDSELGGGRIIGEACHYFDLFIYLTGSLISEVFMSSMGDFNLYTDHATIILKFENGSSATIHYFSNGSSKYPKERIEVYQLGKTAVIDNFQSISSYGFKNNFTSSGMDKGHLLQFKEWLTFLKEGGTPLIPFEEIYNSSSAVLLALRSFQSGVPCKLS